jgi:hypothetical protein
MVKNKQTKKELIKELLYISKTEKSCDWDKIKYEFI